VNFITRDNFEGLELKGSFQNIEDSDGDTSIAAIYGKQLDNIHFAISAEYTERSELQVKDRDWGLRDFADNTKGGISSIGNPGTLFPTFGTTTVAGGVPDVNCNTLGGINAANFCRFQFTFFDNLIEEQETLKLFGEFDIDINDNLRFRMEALYADMDMPAWKTSPSYPPQSLLGADRVIQPNHPGLVDYKLQNPGAFSDITIPGLGTIPVAAQGSKVWSRMLGVTGRNGEPATGKRATETWRVAGGFDGTLSNGIDFDISASWSKRERSGTGSDMYIERMALALDGLGGPNCNQRANFDAGLLGTNGCEYYNPLSNAIQTSAVNGATNPQYNPAVANSDALIDWLTATTGSTTINELFVVDAVFTSETEISLGGGNIGWAAGLQWRSEDYDFSLADIANAAINPCPFVNDVSIDLGHVTTLDCGNTASGQLAFLAATTEETTERETYAAFVELALPLTDTFDVQLAARYEDLGASGDSFDPKIAVSWSATDSLKFRGSASTTFRGPPASLLSGTGTNLAFIGAALAFKAVDTSGNPDLEPETATTLNFGVIFQTDSFYGSVDYWSFDFEDPFQVENQGQLVNAYLANGCADGGAGVGVNPDCSILRGRISPLGAGGTTLERIARNIINGGDIKTTGIDVAAEYSFDDVMDGELTLGFNGTFVLEYESADFVTADGVTLAPGGDFTGKLNVGTPFTPQPDFKGNLFARWGNESHRVTYNIVYVDSYADDIAPNAALATIDDHASHDLHYINNMLEDFTFSLSVINLTDEDPPFASTDLNFDAYTHNPFGRMIKVGVTYVPGFLN
jgi:iron complex outermembrane receptor protein